MGKLDDEIRIALEKNIDSILKDPEDHEKTWRSMLIGQGIEPNLETVLSFLIGDLYGLVWGYYIFRHARDMNIEEHKDLIAVLRRRAFELREAFIGTRIET